jgi:hypothetical protein
VRIVARALHVEEAFASGTAGFVDHHQGLLHQAVFGDDALDGTRHLIGATAGAGRHNEFNRPRGLPRGECRSRHEGLRDPQRGDRAEARMSDLSH